MLIKSLIFPTKDSFKTLSEHYQYLILVNQQLISIDFGHFPLFGLSFFKGASICNTVAKNKRMPDC